MFIELGILIIAGIGAIFCLGIGFFVLVYQSVRIANALEGLRADAKEYSDDFGLHDPDDEEFDDIFEPTPREDEWD